ncbi:DHR2 [Cyberlindnera jadinii]|uniref:RNA helicase n=1 Tax=Cyberlindnera jadinii (strain ATCC 18201 / CBS 1600 / BCRC 20928 / JCM 3617 / NBRC 0987 / NRRL Y-1542) TaxID=983966 RepID=A0A0H5C1C0_CYBJN|nr:DHR2 [Cyberlindnera jadinii]
MRRNNNQKLHRKFDDDESQIISENKPNGNNVDHSEDAHMKRPRPHITELQDQDTEAHGTQPSDGSAAVVNSAPRWAQTASKKKQKVKKSHAADAKTVTFFSDDEEEQQRSSKALSFDQQKAKARELLEVRKTLPVYKAKDELLERLANSRVTVLIGETSSGKSTQIPQFLMPLNKKSIAVTQPRRVAAISLATRVAEEVGTTLGDKVGYSVRFDHKAKYGTKIKYLTDGMILREIMIDSSLSQYSTVIIDEAHERTVLTDLMMGFLKELLQKRKDLKVIIMSATLDAERFSKFFDNADILFVEGRMFKVEKLYLEKSVDDVVDSTIKTIIQVNNGELEGDILVFLPGQEEIDKCVSLLERLAPELPKEAPLIVPLPLYASLPPADQAKVFLPLKARRRKVILATNIAETSVTVPGVRYVIDTGLRKVKVWRHQLGLSTLLTAPVSKASATQRAGRAGREAEGKTFRLYTEDDFMKLPAMTEPEIARSNVVSPVLMLKRAGVDDILNWSWLQNPGQDSLISALTQLHELKALDDNGKITELGEQMAILPLEPQLSAILLTAHKSGCLSDAVDIVSCLSVDNLILNPPSETRDEVNEKRRSLCILGAKYGDLLMLKELLDFYLQFDNSQERKQWCHDLALSHRGFKNVMRVRNQIRQYMVSLTKDKHLFDEEKEKKPLDIPSVLKAFLSGYVSNTAIGMPDRSYRTTTSGQLISVHPSSLMFGKKNDAIMYTDFVYTTKGYARNVSAIELSWLQEVGGHVLAPKHSIA